MDAARAPSTGSARPAPGFWAGKRVLLTGHTGFKGSWAALWLTRMGAHVTGLGLAPEGPHHHFGLADLVDAMDHHVVDLRDQAGVDRVVKEARPDLVLHMAAQALVRQAVADPLTTWATNVQGTAHLLDAVTRHCGDLPVLVVTSDKVYRNDDQGRDFVESDPLGGKDPYSASKAACDILVTSWRLTNRLQKLATVRGGNVIGGGDFAADRIVPDIVRATMRDEPVILRHPEATRPWQHVLDCLSGYFLHLEALSKGEGPFALNIGPRHDPVTPVGEAASAIITALGAKPWVHEPDGASVEARLLSLDATLARTRLGWSDRLSRQDALAWTGAWYRAFLACDASHGSMRSVSEDQLNAYERL